MWLPKAHSCDIDESDSRGVELLKSYKARHILDMPQNQSYDCGALCVHIFFSDLDVGARIIKKMCQ